MTEVYNFNIVQNSEPWFLGYLKEAFYFIFDLIFVFVSLDIIWEIRRQGKTRYKPLTQAECQAIEEDYQVNRLSLLSQSFSIFVFISACITYKHIATGNRGYNKPIFWK